MNTWTRGNGGEPCEDCVKANNLLARWRGEGGE